jgi:hypothetical protein
MEKNFGLNGDQLVENFNRYANKFQTKTLVRTARVRKHAFKAVIDRLTELSGTCDRDGFVKEVTLKIRNDGSQTMAENIILSISQLISASAPEILDTTKEPLFKRLGIFKMFGTPEFPQYAWKANTVEGNKMLSVELVLATLVIFKIETI